MKTSLLRFSQFLNGSPYINYAFVFFFVILPNYIISVAHDRKPIILFSFWSINDIIGFTIVYGLSCDNQTLCSFETYHRSLWSWCCSIFSFMCCALLTIVWLFVHFRLVFIHVVSVLL